MLPGDVPQVSRIDRVCFVLSWSALTFAAELTNTAGYYCVAELDGTVVGYIGSQMILDEAHITTFGVLPNLRRRRIGERLLLDVLTTALGAGCRRVTLEVRESNTSALALYRKYGFTPISRRARYYSDNDEDAVVMWIEDLTRLGFRTLLAERSAELDRLDRQE
jgi:[ribosomal protein S18]-alanine N-acetyltransferase